jgi:Protein of unknown function (DUF3592)
VLPFVIIFLVAGVGLVIAGRNLERQARLSASWPTVTGELESCEVVELRSTRPDDADDQDSWQLRLRYSYVVRGTTYHSTRYAFGYGDGSDDAKHRKIADALKRGPQLIVHYDPRHPSEAVISTEPQTNVKKIGYATLAVAVVTILIGMTGRW